MDRIRHALRMLLLGAAALAPAAEPAAATDLQFFHAPTATASFWDPNNWIPTLSPGSGDSVRITNNILLFGPIYLGDVPGFPAQTRTISRLHFDTSGPAHLEWGAGFLGGAAGGLRFSQDHFDDSGIGIRVARTVSGVQVIRLIDAENVLADAFNLAIGTQDPFLQSQTNRLELIESSAAAPKTLHLDSVRLEGAGSELEIGQRLEADSIASVPQSTGHQVRIPSGELTATRAEFVRVWGAGQTPFFVSHAGTVDLDLLVLTTEDPGNDAVIRIGAEPPFEDGGEAQVETLEISASEESRSGIVVDATGPTGIASTPTTALAVGTIEGATLGGTLSVSVLGGGRLDATFVQLSNDGPSSTGVPGAVEVLADGAGSTITGELSVTGGGATIVFSDGAECAACNVFLSGVGSSLRFETGSRASGNYRVSEASVEFVDGAIVEGAALQVGGGAQATIRDSAATRFAGIQLDGLNVLPDPAVAITTATPGAAFTTVVAGSIQLANDYFLFANGSSVGGDRPFSGTARFALSAGSRLRIGDDPLRNERPMLAIGTSGAFTLDPTSAVFVGHADTSPVYQVGQIVVDDGGHLRGNGRINGTGFPGGAHPVVVNTGGETGSGFSPGRLAIEGEYVQQSGVTTFEIAGAQPGEFDVVDATAGATMLGGVLRFERLGSYAGVIGAQLDFFAGRPVHFEPGVVIEDNSGFGLAFDFETGIATITQTVPEPSAGLLLGAGLALVRVLSRSRGRSRSPKVA